MSSAPVPRESPSPQVTYLRAARLLTDPDVHAIHDREYERRRPADQQYARKAFNPRQHPPARPDDNVAESDCGVGH